jgi:two-component system sensor histidine kinase DevS
VGQPSSHISDAGAEGPPSTRPLSEVGLGDELGWEVVEAAPDGMVLADEGGQILLVNRQIEALFGYERTELLGRPVEDLVPDQLRGVHRAHRTRYRAEPRTRAMGTDLKLRARRKDGTEFPVEVSLSPLRFDGGLLVVAAVRDVSERAAAEAELRRVYDLLDATRDAVLIFDWESLRFSYANQGAAAQLGYRVDELLTMTMLHVAPEFTEAELRERLAPLNDGAVESLTFTTTHRRRDGTDLPVEILVQAGPTDPETGSRSFVKIVRDITDRVAADEQLQRAGEELRVLEDRERIGRDLHDIVVQRLFAAGMSLNAVSSLIVDRDDASRRLAEVIDELDATIREIRTAIYGLQSQAANPTGLRSQVLAIVQEQRAALGTEPRLRFDGLLDLVADDIGQQLLVALREALSNVARHAAATRVEVALDAGEELTLTVIDNGIGMPDTPEGGHGLRNLATRAKELGGTFRTSPGKNGGTVLEWSVPNRRT